MKSSAKALAARLPAPGTGVWKPDEDARLMKAVATYSGKNWKAVAAEVGTRNHIQCLQRWSKALNPNLEKGECHLYQCLVAGRVCLTAPPYLFEGRWHPEEDQQLHKLAKEHGLNWKMVTRFWVTGGQCRDRTGKQIRDRWISMLDPSINKGPWTAAEDQLLLEQHSIMGNAWTKIALLLPGRTGNKAKARYRILARLMRNCQKQASERPPGLSQIKGEGNVMAVSQKRSKGYLEQDESAVVDLLKGKLKPAVMCNRPDPLSILALCAVHD